MYTQFISRKTWVAVLGAALLPMGAWAQEEPLRPADPTTSATQQRITPQQFVQQAALSGLKEVRLGQIAVQKAEDSQVKQFGQQMIQDHSEANRKLTQIAQSKGFQVPDTNAFSRAGRQYVRERETAPGTPRTGREDTRTQPGAPTGRQPGQTQQSYMMQQDLQIIQQLESMSGSEFDKAYINQMVQDHAKAVQKFETASETLQDEELKTFATETLPKLREHHQMAQQLATQIGGAQNQPGQTQPLQPQDRTPTEPRQPQPQNPNR
jgi:putative membrane protein